MPPSPEYRDLSWLKNVPLPPDARPLTEMDEATLDQMARWMARACMDRLARERAAHTDTPPVHRHPAA